MKDKIFIIKYELIGIGLIVLIWEFIFLITENKFIPEFFLSFGNMFSLLFTTNIIIDILLTILRLFIAFSVSSLIGITFGVISGIYKRHEIILSPLNTLLKAIPTIAFILILITYVKFSYIYVVSILITPIIYQTTLNSIKSQIIKYKNIILIKEDKISLNTIFKILIPGSFKDIFNSFIQTLSLGLKAQILSESFSYTVRFRGLGKLIYNEYYQYNILNMMSLILVAIILSLLLDMILFRIRDSRKIVVFKY